MAPNLLFGLVLNLWVLRSPLVVSPPPTRCTCLSPLAFLVVTYSLARGRLASVLESGTCKDQKLWVQARGTGFDSKVWRLLWGNLFICQKTFLKIGFWAGGCVLESWGCHESVLYLSSHHRCASRCQMTSNTWWNAFHNIGLLGGLFFLKV